ncbi:uncharacterized protein LOC110997007 [Pieris rapae]|uniref:uncharacterized protein LOC110997007 n=1 Tax=Pieris rapae TaxID=64459 RepID=UPI001E27F9FF|nr:uncharacterized protein LOC110997007 [Pieris rapae]XP_045489775.1 uncharacterized protein LOC110997007 [Pieris rapae]
MGGERFYNGDSSLRVHPFSDPTNSSSGSIRIFTQPHSIAQEYLIEPSTTPNINPDIWENPTIAENNNDNTQHSLVNSVAGSSDFPEQRQPTSRGSTPSRLRCRGSEYGESRVRRRLRLQPSHPSQRRNYLHSTTEKFLRIEEQRLNLDTKILDLLNQKSIRDTVLIETITNNQEAIIKGQNAIVEALKTIAMAINK